MNRYNGKEGTLVGKSGKRESESHKEAETELDWVSERREGQKCYVKETYWGERAQSKVR
jgi:hypothetical protein